jgi:mRNA interferase MazF
VIAVALTSQPPGPGFPFSLEIESDKLPRRTWAKISQVRTLSVQRLGKFIDRLSADQISMVVEGLNDIIAE